MIIKTLNSLVIAFLLILMCQGEIFSQLRINKIVSANGEVQKINFSDSIASKVTEFDIDENNPFLRMGLKTKTAANPKVYDLSVMNKKEVVSSFFENQKAPENLANVSFKEAHTYSYVSIQKNGALVAYYLNFYDSSNSLVGISSKILVLDENSKIISKFPMNNDGYFEPTITQDRRYLSCITGDVVSHAKNSLIQVPSFKIYDIQSGLELFKLENSGEYSILPPFSIENLVIEVIRRPGGIYEYYVFFPDLRHVYKKKYTREEIGFLKKIDSTGFTFSNKGEAQLDQYNVVFEKEKF